MSPDVLFAERVERSTTPEQWKEHVEYIEYLKNKPIIHRSPSKEELFREKVLNYNLEIKRIRSEYGKSNWKHLSFTELINKLNITENRENVIKSLIQEMNREGTLGRKMREYLYLTGQLKKQTQKVSENSI